MLAWSIDENYVIDLQFIVKSSKGLHKQYSQGKGFSSPPLPVVTL